MYEIIIGRSESEKKSLGLKGTVFLGKHYVTMGSTTSMSNKLFMDVSKSHVVLVSGKRGSGKCLTGDTLITLSDGSIIPIKELEHNKINVLGLDEKLKIKEINKTDFFKRKVNKILYLKLRSGKEIKLTPEHPLLTIKGWKNVKELKIGSRIATPRIIPIFGKEKMPENEIKLLAYLITGWCIKKVVWFTNFDEKIMEEYKESVLSFDKNLKLEKKDAGSYRAVQKIKKYRVDIVTNKKGQKFSIVRYEKSSIMSWLNNLGRYNKKSRWKFIPKCIFLLPKEQLKIFLSRLFSCDGTIYKKKTKNNITWEISYASASEVLIKQVQHLLLRFGIYGKIRVKKTKYDKKLFDSFELNVSQEGIINFIEEIGFWGEKSEKEETALEETTFKKRNPNVDTIPKEIWELYKPNNWAGIGRTIGYAPPKAMRERIRYSPSRQTLLQIAKADDNNSLKLLAESDIFWDEIIEMKLIEEETEVYDISVPELHNFIANDIIVHNSHLLGVIAEEMAGLSADIKNKIAVLMFDTMGIFWTMRYPNKKDEDLLAQWDIKQRGLDIDIYTPKGHFNEYKLKGIPADFAFSLSSYELSAADWCSVFEINTLSKEGLYIELIISNLKSNNENFDIDDILSEIKENDETAKAVTSLFNAAKLWGIFSKDATKIKNLFEGGKVSILDISAYKDWNIKNLVIGILCKKLMQERVVARKKEEVEDINKGHSYFKTELENTGKEMPLVWIFLDEAHNIMGADKDTPATDPLIRILREGRQPGISLVMATQQPGQLNKDAISQTDILISLRLTSKKDLDSIGEIMQTYVSEDLQKYFAELPKLKGAAIILDDNSEKIYRVQIRPKFSWHGGDDPTALKPLSNYFKDLDF